MDRNYELKKDIVLKDYFRNPCIFADFLNGSLYGGKHHYHENCFENDDTDMSLVDSDKLKTYERRRDVAFKYKNNKEMTFICLENQSQVDELMPVRLLVYDAFRYNKQLQRGNDIHYVKTLTFYCGDREWNYPYNLKEVLKGERDGSQEDNDWKMELIDLKRLEEQNYKVESNQLLVKYGKMVLKDGRNPEKFRGIKISRQVFILLASLLGTEQLFEYGIELKEEEVNMCESLELLMKDGEARGRSEGRIEGKIESKVEDIKKIASKLNMTFTEAMDFLDIPVRQRGDFEIFLTN